MSKMYDVIVIGAGPAGLSAALYAGRARLKTLVVEKKKEGGQIALTSEVENYPGCVEGESGPTLIDRMYNQAKHFGAVFVYDEIESVDLQGSIKQLNGKKDVYKSKAVIVATGASSRPIGCPGEKEFIGKGVSYCATCDGMFFKNRKVLVIGGGNSAAQESIFLTNLGCDVQIVHRRDELRAEKYLTDVLDKKGINVIWNAVVKEIKGSQTVESVILEKTDGSIIEVETDALFVAIGDLPQNELAISLGVKLDDAGYIITDKQQKTNVDHIYAAGDITGGIKQWVVACGEGAVASSIAFNERDL